MSYVVQYMPLAVLYYTLLGKKSFVVLFNLRKPSEASQPKGANNIDQ